MVVMITSRHHRSIKSSASALYWGLPAAAPGPAATADGRALCQRDGPERVAASYRDVGICVSARDRRGTGSLVTRGPDRV